MLDPRNVEKIAAEAAQRVGVAAVLRHAGGERVFQQVEECERFVERAPVNRDATFIALALPIASALLHYATTRKRLNDARQWVLTNWVGVGRPSDPITMLSVLTLIHIVNEGAARHRGDPEKAAVWSRIKRHLDKLLSGEEAAIA